MASSCSGAGAGWCRWLGPLTGQQCGVAAGLGVVCCDGPCRCPCRWPWSSTAQRPPLPLPPHCSDILTPLPAFGIPFEIDDDKGPLLDAPIRSTEQLKALHAIDLQQLSFVGESLGLIRREVGGQAATLGFVGCPWTLATYVVEGASSSIYKNIKTMMFNSERRGGWG